MSLVGDIIMGCREQMTDLPSALPSPVVTSASTTAPISGPVSFPTGSTVNYQVTQSNPWGESGATATATLAIGFGGPFSAVIAGFCSFMATSVRVYFSTTPGGFSSVVPPLDQFFELPVSQQGTFVVIVGGTSSGFSTAPVRSSAWNPDTDGTSASAFTMYRWLNDGSETLGLTVGGIRDTTGIPTAVGVAQYSLIHRWKKIDNVFYRGYPLIQGTKQQVFRHSPVTGLSGTVTVNTSAERQIMEFWPQPDETAGIGTLTSAIGITDTSLTYTPGSSSFQLGFGMAIIGTYPPTAQLGANSCELVYFSGTGDGSQLEAMTRGLGGTMAQAWPVGTVVQEGLVYMTGLRFPQKYMPGQANFVLSLPSAWVDALRVYMLYRFRDAEQNRQEAKSLLDEFNQKAKELASQHQLAGPRQVQIGGASGVEVASGFGSPFGGIVIP